MATASVSGEKFPSGFVVVVVLVVLVVVGGGVVVWCTVYANDTAIANCTCYADLDRYGEGRVRP